MPSSESESDNREKTEIGLYLPVAHKDYLEQGLSYGDSRSQALADMIDLQLDLEETVREKGIHGNRDAIREHIRTAVEQYDPD